MSELSLTSPDFEDGGEIPKKCGYKHGNVEPELRLEHTPSGTKAIAIVMDDPDAMKAVGKVWVHFLCYSGWAQDADYDDRHQEVLGKTDFGEIGYGGPAPPDGRHTYIFKAYALDTELELKEGFSKQELEDSMKGHILAEAKLTGTFAP